jgi:hypothetical protein
MKLHKVFIKKVCLSLCFFAVAFLRAKTDAQLLDTVTSRKFDCKQLEVLYVIETKKSFVAFVQYKKGGGKFCVKQLKILRSRQKMALVREVAAAVIAEMAGLPVNRVRLLKPEHDFPGKVVRRQMATVHTFAEGDSASHYDKWKRDNDLALSQSIKRDRPDLERGLKFMIIRSMGKHTDLPAIVAFDIYIGNNDRRLRNIFYDQKTDSFVAIDSEKSFRAPLGLLAVNNIQYYLGHPETLAKFSEKDIAGLKQCNRTLKALLALCPPAKVKRIFEEQYELSGLGRTRIHDLESTYRFIDSNTKNVSSLVKLIDELIAVWKRAESRG